MRLTPGLVLDTPAGALTVTSVALSAAARSATRGIDRVHPPVRITARHDSVHIHRAGEPTVAFGGLPARILSELVAFAGPTAWDVVAGEIWRDCRDPDQRHTLRRKWDVNLSRLRSKLRGARLRPDLVRSDGSGNVELVLYPGDHVLDHTDFAETSVPGS